MWEREVVPGRRTGLGRGSEDGTAGRVQTLLGSLEAGAQSRTGVVVVVGGLHSFLDLGEEGWDPLCMGVPRALPSVLLKGPGVWTGTSELGPHGELATDSH